MRKETTFAVIFGVTLGLILAFGIFRANKAIKQNAESASNDSGNTKETASEISVNSALTLLRPDNMQVFGDDIIQITGTTKAGSYVVVSGGTSDFITKNQSDGSFNFEYEIDPSINFLNVNSITEDNSRSVVKLEVVYSSEASKPGSEETNAVEEKVSEKLENAQKKAEFFKGTVTDIAGTNIQMKTTSGEIKQVSYSTATSFAKVGKTSTKIAASDVAIGDYIMALGYGNDNSVLDAFRIIVTQPETSEEVSVFYGTVSVKNKTDMEVSQQNSNSILIAIDNNSKTYKGDDPVSSEKARFANISEGDTVIGTYVVDKDENIARRIYILKSQAE